MYPAPARHPPAPGSGGSAGSSAGGLKFTVADTCERIKEEFNFIQQQYHSLKLECEKLASEKTEMQRHYVMYYEMSYGLNVEMHKQTEIAKRLNTIIIQLLPFLAQEHQQQVASAVERAKQVTMSDLNTIIGQQQQQGLQQLLQQIHAQQLPHGAVVGGLPPGSLLGFAGAAAAAAAAAAAGLPAHLSSGHAVAAAASQAAAQALLKSPHEHSVSSRSTSQESQQQQHRSSSTGTPESSGGRKSTASTIAEQERGSSRGATASGGGGSISPPEKFRNTRTPEVECDPPKRRKEDKLPHEASDGEKSDQDLVVDVANETIQANGEHPEHRENGSLEKHRGTPSSNSGSHPQGLSLKDRPPSRSGSSSSRSTPSLKNRQVPMHASESQLAQLYANYGAQHAWPGFSAGLLAAHAGLVPPRP